MNELMDRYNQALSRINNDEMQGLLSEEDANFHRQSLVEELEEAQFAAQQQEQSEEGAVAQFSAGNSLGATLLQVGGALGYTDAETYVNDLASELGISADEVVYLITSEEEPDEELGYAVVSELGLVEEEGDYYDEEEPEAEYDEEPYVEEEESSYSAYDPRVDELEAQLAEFQAQNVLKDTLHKLDLRGQELVNSGDMPPMAYNIVFSKFDSEDDRIAAFSQVAEANGNTLMEELTAIEKTLEIFGRMRLGEIGLFSQLIEDESVGEFSQEEAAIDQEAELYVQHFRANRR